MACLLIFSTVEKKKLNINDLKLLFCSGTYGEVGQEEEYFLSNPYNLVKDQNFHFFSHTAPHDNLVSEYDFKCIIVFLPC